ncbi:AlpA family transcriptional regulator [Citrobacter portucalensis]|uniref:helix-turn-helix transcriptional regulator n=1 Tax=Enterobacterales TaxID=91347 RepID=UPI001EF8A26E|nr:AlpA family transcriptional regulator [Citrobacter portucalensis]ULK51940.1 AlpA family transcriptional regulator [Citrobacter portucalensis]
MTIQTPPTTSLLNDQFVDMKFITHLTGLTDKWFYKLIQDGEFPKPIKLGRSSRWLKSEVEQWLQARIDESRGGNSALGS